MKELAEEPIEEKGATCIEAKVIAVFDLMGGKPGCHFQMGGGSASPTITRGRGACSDIHSLVIDVEVR